MHHPDSKQLNGSALGCFGLQVTRYLIGLNSDANDHLCTQLRGTDRGPSQGRFHSSACQGSSFSPSLVFVTLSQDGLWRVWGPGQRKRRVKKQRGRV